jgi:putative hydrolase of the HAD superfamily
LKLIVFDLGGTLMQYEGMSYSWVEFYQQGIDAIIQKYNCNVSMEDIQKSVQILKDFNPRVSGREVEYSAEHIFSNALEHWNIDTPIKNCIETFWQGLKLSAKIYPDTIEVLKELKEKGYIIVTLTDLPNAMPDEIFKKDISELLSYFDYYVSSCVAGYRKPNCKGLQMISDKYGVPVTELVFVGDEEKDRKTACNANCKFVHIQRTTKSEGIISSLYELLQLMR